MLAQFRLPFLETEDPKGVYVGHTTYACFQKPLLSYATPSQSISIPPWKVPQNLHGTVALRVSLTVVSTTWRRLHSQCFLLYFLLLVFQNNTLHNQSSYYSSAYRVQSAKRFTCVACLILSTPPLGFTHLKLKEVKSLALGPRNTEVCASHHCSLPPFNSSMYICGNFHECPDINGTYDLLTLSFTFLEI